LGGSLKTSYTSPFFQSVSDAKADESKMSTFKKIPAAIKALLLNPTYMFISIGAAADGLVIAGLSAFLPKFIQSQYKFTASLSSGIVGKPMQRKIRSQSYDRELQRQRCKNLQYYN
jgi:hypothetical protein